jgi:GT2 family glycosyltransferase
MTGSAPAVSVLVLDDGSSDLERRLASVAAQEYPTERVQPKLVKRAPGFAAPCNAAVVQATTEFVAILPTDAALDPRCLAEMVDTAQRSGAAAVASTPLDQNGRPIPIARGLTIVGRPFPVRPPLDGQRLLSAAGSCALFERASFLDAGGLDEAFGDSLDDVDLGWRLNLLGHSIVLARGAIAYRETHAEPSPWVRARECRLIERNALAMIYRNFETPTLARVLPVAISLCLLRALSGSGIDALRLELASRPPDSVEVSLDLVAHLIALEDFCRQLRDTSARRRRLQEQRRRTDADLWPLFGGDSWRQTVGGLQPLANCGQTADSSPAEIVRTLIDDFGLRDLIAGDSAHSAWPAPPSMPPPAPASVRATSKEPPRVSIVILTAVGATYVVECLASLRRQTYPPDRMEILVVDNGSAEDPTAAIQEAYPGARVIRNGSNVGFAAGNNVGAREATGEFVVFLNDDTRLHPDWLTELVKTAARHGAAAVCSCILDWAGERIDFIDAAINFEAKGSQLHYDAAVGDLQVREKPLVFANGCALLVDRAVFTDAGGWDDETFAYYEDVELGCRLNLMGHSVWMAPEAIVYHKHHGTSGSWPLPPRTRLLERNSLRIVYEIFELPSLQRLLSASLLLASQRALLGTPLSHATDPGDRLSPRPRLTPRTFLRGAKSALIRRGVPGWRGMPRAIVRLGAAQWLEVLGEAIDPRRTAHAPEARTAYLAERGPLPNGVDIPERQILPIDAAAVLSGIHGFLLDLPALSMRRAQMQQRRRISDEEFISRFGSHWRIAALVPYQREYDELHAIITDELVDNAGRPQTAGP